MKIYRRSHSVEMHCDGMGASDDDDDDILGSPWFDTLMKDRLAKRTTSFIAVIRGKAANYVVFYL